MWDVSEREAFVDFIARNPQAGDLIPGGAGIRKLRWSRSGMGKRGGARVIYFYFRADRPLYLLMAYAKAQQEDMTPEQKREVAKLVTALRS